MRIIFLDFDGVINNCGEFDDYVFYPIKDKKGNYHNLPISASNIRYLKELFEYCFKNNINFVLSTSWRELISYDEINKAFKNFFGFSYLSSALFIGETPCIYAFEEAVRGKEIELYLKEFDLVEDYLIIDDNFDFLEKQKSHVILTNPVKGFSEKELKKVKKYFLQEKSFSRS